MKAHNLFILIFLFTLANSPLRAQNQRTHIQQNEIYSDRITDEYGQALSGIRISVQGTNRYTFSDLDGYFSIKASRGDKIILSKNGKKINSYRLDGRLNYEIPDLSEKVITTESKRKKFKKSSYSTKNTQYLLDSARIFSTKSPYKSIDYIESFLSQNKRLTPTDLFNSYTLLADNYIKLKQYDLAVNNYQNALKYKKDIDVSIKLANALSQNKQWQIAEKNYRQLLKEDITSWQTSMIWEGIGLTLEKQGQIDEAIQAYQKALQKAEKDNVQSKIYALNAKIAALLSKKGNKLKAEEYIHNSINTVQKAPIQKRALIQNELAGVYEASKEYDKEIKLRKKTLADIEESFAEEKEFTNEPMVLEKVSKSQLNLDIGKAYLNKKEYKKAIPFLEKSALEAKKKENLEVQKNALQKLSELYKKVGDSKKSLQNYQEYARIVDALYKQKEEEIQAAVKLNKVLREKQNRISSLEKDRELSESRYKLSQSQQQLTQANYRRQKMLIYGLVSGLILLGIALFYMYKSNKERRLANNLLALKSLRSQMNPHFIFNALNSVNNFIAQNDERTANKYLTDFSKLMRSVLNNSEKDFIPLEKEIELLELYLQLEHARFKEKFDYSIEIDKNLKIEEFQIPPMLLQPYVENAVWHGLRYKKEKGKLQINFTKIDSETMQISITDDGIGRKKSKDLKTQNQKKQQSKGMGNIRKRIQILNEMYSDKVDVTISDLSEDQTGTKVILTLKKD